MSEQSFEILERVKARQETARLEGTLHTINSRGAWGLIRFYPAGEPRRDHFFHLSDLEDAAIFRTLECGDILSFLPCEDEKGFRAADVRLRCQRHLRSHEPEVIRRKWRNGCEQPEDTQC